MRPLAFELLPREFLENSGILWKIVENRQKSQFRYLEKGVLELRRATTIKPTKHQEEFSLVASIKVKFFAYITKNGVLSFLILTLKI